MAAAILDVLWLYLAIGGAVAAVFVVWGVGRIEPSARGAWTFRPLIAPGVAMLWPLVLWRWRVVARGEDAARRSLPPRRAQAGMALALALAIPLALTLGVLVRQDGPRERAAVRLAPAEALP